jgi:hypothetical protein
MMPAALCDAAAAGMDAGARGGRAADAPPAGSIAVAAVASGIVSRRVETVLLMLPAGSKQQHMVST